MKDLVSNKNGETMYDNGSKAISCWGKMLNLCAGDQTPCSDCKIRMLRGKLNEVVNRSVNLGGTITC